MTESRVIKLRLSIYTKLTMEPRAYCRWMWSKYHGTIPLAKIFPVSFRSSIRPLIFTVYMILLTSCRPLILLHHQVTEPLSSAPPSNDKIIQIKQDYILVPVTKLGAENYAIFHNNKLFQINNPTTELVPDNHHAEPVPDENYRHHVHLQDKEVGTSQTYNNQGSQYHINQTNQASQHQITQSNQGSQYHGPGSHQSSSDYYHGPGSHQSGAEHSTMHCHSTTQNHQGSQYSTATVQNNQGTQHETPKVHQTMHSQGSQYQQNNQGSQYHGPGSHQSAPDNQYQINQNQQTSQGSQHQGSHRQPSQHHGPQVERYNQGSINLEHQGVQCDLQQRSYSQWIGTQTSLINPFSSDHNARWFTKE